jgi:hypothetical protein
VDLIGKRFGKLTVKALAPSDGQRKRWVCRCKCGQHTVVRDDHLRSGNTTSCGCARAVGVPVSPALRQYQQVGRWMLLRPDGIDGYAETYWLCRCECGTVRSVRARSLKRGTSNSCGCLRADPGVRREARMKVPAAKRRKIARLGGSVYRKLLDQQGEN